MVCVNRLEMLKYAIRENGGGGGLLYLSSLSVGFYSNFFMAYVCLISVSRFSNSRETCRTYQTRLQKCCVVSLSIV